MKRILITGAGGGPALNFTRSLAAAPERMFLIGVDCNKYYLQRSECDERHLIPRATDEDYMLVLQDVIRESGAEFIHTQNDIEMRILSEQRSQLSLKFFLPSRETVRTCMNKFETHQRWHDAGLPQPRTVMINDQRDLSDAFKTLGPRLWLREVVGAAGKGSLPTSDPEVAQAWLDFRQGWGRFTAAEYLSPDSVTWQSIWNEGELIVAQSRKRLYWEFADRAPSGVTGLTGAAITFADPSFDALAQRAILAIDPKPHGIFSVDMTYDGTGQPNPTEINIGRFFTTHEFFTQAGLNMPYIYVKLAHGEEVELPAIRINPLPPDLLWIRGMDVTPVLLPRSKVEECEEKLLRRIQTLKQK